MVNTKTHEKRKYRVEGIFWIPGYNDFDFEDFEIEAYNKKQAKQLAMKHPMWQLAKREPAISRVCNTNILQLETLVDDFINSDINR